MNAALGLADSPARATAAGAPTPVKLRTARDFSLTTTALEHRAEDLEKLSKKTKEEGYFAEARTIDGDVGAIREIILPLFREQKELPLVTHDDLEATVKNAIHATIHRFAVSSDSASRADRVRGADALDGGEKWQGKREADLSAAIARAVASFAIEIAESSYAAGLAARDMTPLALAKRSSFALADSIGE
jgi:hypothetical protein